MRSQVHRELHQVLLSGHCACVPACPYTLSEVTGSRANLASLHHSDISVYVSAYAHIRVRILFWQSFFAWGMLKYNGKAGDKSYSLTMVGETGVNTSSGDKNKRGAEYSALEVFDGKLLTFCDRTGNVDEIVLDRDSDGKITAKIEHLVDGEGKQVSIT